VIVLFTTCAFDSITKSIHGINVCLQQHPPLAFEPPSRQSLSVLLSSSSSLFPSLFVMADEDAQLEKKARFVLNARNRRRGLFDSTIMQLQSTHNGDAEENECIYYSPSEDRWTYELCLGRHIRRMVLELDHRLENEQWLTIDSNRYRIREVEHMGSHYKFSGNGNEGRKEFVNQLKKVWGDDAIAFENSKGEPVQNYVSGDSCPDVKMVKYGTRIVIQGCCPDSLSVENESRSDGMRVVELTEEDTCRYDIRVCSICPQMKTTTLIMGNPRSRRPQKARKLKRITSYINR
jgi:hypothetical protein